MAERGASGTASRPGGRGRITQASIDQVLQRSDLVDLASGYTQLRKQGAEHLGRCPFHDERTPSFWVNGAKGVYHCFGCGASGDVVAFVQAKQGLDFVEAIELLADRYRVQLEREGGDGGDAERRTSKRRLYELSDAAASFYEAWLWKSAGADHARRYLASRHVTEETARAFRIGCSPPGGDVMARKAQARGFSRQELQDARLVSSAGRDFFRGRLMVPIIDRADRVIAFGARKLSDEQFGGKYMNSGEGPLFSKKRTVFLGPGLRAAADAAGSVLVVEGYMDVIALWQAGFRTTCAVMGTSLTEEQVVELKRLAPRALFAFDPDAAGQVATLRALELARRHDLDVRVVLLPAGEDPADVVLGADGRDRMEELLDSSVSLLHYRVSALLGSGDVADSGDRERIYREGATFLASVPDTPEKRQQADRLAAALGLDTGGTAMLQGQTGGLRPLPAMRRRPAGGPPPRARRLPPALQDEKRYLAVAMRQLERGAQRVPVPGEAFSIDLHRRFYERLVVGDAAGVQPASMRDDEDLIGLVAELEALLEREAVTDDLLDELAAELAPRVERRHLDRLAAQLREQLDTAGSDAQLQARLGDVTRRRRQLDPRAQDDPAEPDA